MILSKLKFYQCRPRSIDPMWRVGEIVIYAGSGGASISLWCNRSVTSQGFTRTPADELVYVAAEVFTDSVSIFRRLDKMRVFTKIDRAKLRNSDDLARLLVRCGLEHVEKPGAQYDPDGGASQRRRIKELHS